MGRAATERAGASESTLTSAPKTSLVTNYELGHPYGKMLRTCDPRIAWSASCSLTYWGAHAFRVWHLASLPRRSKTRAGRQRLPVLRVGIDASNPFATAGEGRQGQARVTPVAGGGRYAVLLCRASLQASPSGLNPWPVNKPNQAFRQKSNRNQADLDQKMRSGLESFLPTVAMAKVGGSLRKGLGDVHERKPSRIANNLAHHSPSPGGEGRDEGELKTIQFLFLFLWLPAIASYPHGAGGIGSALHTGLGTTIILKFGLWLIHRKRLGTTPPMCHLRRR